MDPPLRVPCRPDRQNASSPASDKGLHVTATVADDTDDLIDAQPLSCTLRFDVQPWSCIRW